MTDILFSQRRSSLTLKQWQSENTGVLSQTVRIVECRPLTSVPPHMFVLLRLWRFWVEVFVVQHWHLQAKVTGKKKVMRLLSGPVWVLGHHKQGKHKNGQQKNESQRPYAESLYSQGVIFCAPPFHTLSLLHNHRTPSSHFLACVIFFSWEPKCPRDWFRCRRKLWCCFFDPMIYVVPIRIAFNSLEYYLIVQCYR